MKGNQGNLHKDAALYFESLAETELKEKTNYHYTVEKDHGRIEERKYYSIELPKGFHSEDFENLKTIAMVNSTRIVGEKETTEIRYFISSLKNNLIEKISTAIHSHWQIENKLYWQLDVSFNEDRWKAKLGNAAKNMASINKMALNLLSKEKTSGVGVKNRRLLAGWDTEYLEKVLLKASPAAASIN